MSEQPASLPLTSETIDQLLGIEWPPELSSLKQQLQAALAYDQAYQHLSHREWERCRQAWELARKNETDGDADIGRLRARLEGRLQIELERVDGRAKKFLADESRWHWYQFVTDELGEGDNSLGGLADWAQSTETVAPAARGDSGIADILTPGGRAEARKARETLADMGRYLAKHLGSELSRQTSRVRPQFKSNNAQEVWRTALDAIWKDFLDQKKFHLLPADVAQAIRRSFDDEDLELPRFLAEGVAGILNANNERKQALIQATQDNQLTPTADSKSEVSAFTNLYPPASIQHKALGAQAVKPSRARLKSILVGVGVGIAVIGVVFFIVAGFFFLTRIASVTPAATTISAATPHASTGGPETQQAPTPPPDNPQPTSEPLLATTTHTPTSTKTPTGTPTPPPTFTTLALLVEIESLSEGKCKQESLGHMCFLIRISTTQQIEKATLRLSREVIRPVAMVDTSSDGEVLWVQGEKPRDVELRLTPSSPLSMRLGITCTPDGCNTITVLVLDADGKEISETVRVEAVPLVTMTTTATATHTSTATLTPTATATFTHTPTATATQ